MKIYFPGGDKIKEQVDELVADLSNEIYEMNKLFDLNWCPNILPYD